MSANNEAVKMRQIHIKAALVDKLTFRKVKEIKEQNVTIIEWRSEIEGSRKEIQREDITKKSKSWPKCERSYTVLRGRAVVTGTKETVFPSVGTSPEPSGS